MKPIKKITVCGGGNGAQTLVPVAAQAMDCPVDIFAPFGDEALRLQGEIELSGAVTARAQARRTSADPAQVIPGSDVVVLVLPAFAHESTLRLIAPFLDQGALLGAIPARGGFDYCAVQALADQGRGDLTLFGLQTLPWACRIRQYGRSVKVLGVKKAVDAASRPASRIGQIAPVLTRMLGMAVEPASSFLALSLANTGQLIHPGIMYGHFSEWDGLPLAQIPLFYHGLSNKGASALAKLDAEVQSIRSRLDSELEMTAVRPLRDWLIHSYGSAIADPSTLHSAFVTNRAYAGLEAPMRQIGPGEFVPDFSARYLSEDVPFGLAVSRAIAHMAGLETPSMDLVINWAGVQLNKDYIKRDASETRVPQNYQLDTLDRLMDFSTER